jgi:hypothetical protein
MHRNPESSDELRVGNLGTALMTAVNATVLALAGTDLSISIPLGSTLLMGEYGIMYNLGVESNSRFGKIAKVLLPLAGTAVGLLAAH